MNVKKLSLWMLLLLGVVESLSASVEVKEFKNRQAFYLNNHYGDSYYGAELFLSHDKRKFIFLQDDNFIKILRKEDGKPLKIFEKLDNISSVSSSDNNRSILIYSTSGENNEMKKISLLDVEKEKFVTILEERNDVEGANYRINITPDGHYVIYTQGGCSQDIINIWDVQKEKLVKQISPHEGRYIDIDINGIAVSPKSNFFLIRTYQNFFSVWNFKGEVLTDFSLKRDMRWPSMRISSDEKRIFIENYIVHMEGNSTKIEEKQKQKKKKVYRANLKDPKEIKKFDLEKVERMDSTVISANGKYIASMSHSGEVLVWNIEESRLLQKFDENNESSSAEPIALTSTGEYLIVWDYNALRVWNLETKEMKIITVPFNFYSVGNFSLSRDNRYLMVSSFGKNSFSFSPSKVKIWDFKESKLIESRMNLGEINRNSFSLEHDYLVTGSIENTILLYETKDMRHPIKEFVYGSKGSWIVFDYMKHKLYRHGAKELLMRQEILPKGFGCKVVPFE